MPPETAAYLRLLTVRARPNEEARLIETLRDQQPRFVDLGSRRVAPRAAGSSGGSARPSRSASGRTGALSASATGGRPEKPALAKDLADWSDRIHLETYDGIEIAPRLPAASGPPIYVIDEDLRIVDITAAAAAAIGWAAEDLVGKSVLDISLGDPESLRAEPWETLLQTGHVGGEGPWLVPDSGAVFIRYLAARDVPIVGRHTVLVHRWHEPVPTDEDLEAALREAFPARAG